MFDHNNLQIPSSESAAILKHVLQWRNLRHRLPSSKSSPFPRSPTSINRSETRASVNCYHFQSVNVFILSIKGNIPLPMKLFRQGWKPIKLGFAKFESVSCVGSGTVRAREKINLVILNKLLKFLNSRRTGSHRGQASRFARSKASPQPLFTRLLSARPALPRPHQEKKSKVGGAQNRVPMKEFQLHYIWILDILRYRG